MAVLTEPKKPFGGPFDLADEPTPPEGTFLATCIECKDQFGVTRTKFQSTETEVVDLTAFLFGFRDQLGSPYKIATQSMKISGNEKAALYLFLRSWLGKPFGYGGDYAAPEAQGGMVGRKALITISHEQRRNGDGVFAKIISVSPVPTGFTQAAPAAPSAAPAPAPAPKPQPKPATDKIPF